MVLHSLTGFCSKNWGIIWVTLSLCEIRTVLGNRSSERRQASLLINDREEVGEKGSWVHQESFRVYRGQHKGVIWM